MKKSIISTLAVVAITAMSISLKAQTTEVKPPKNSILSVQQQTIVEKELAPLPEIQEANVMWKKTIIREIDFRQKINQPFYYPLNPLEDWKNFITVVYDAIHSGEMTVYRVENNVDDMVTPLTREEFEKEGGKIGDPPVIQDENGNDVENLLPFKERMSNVMRLRIKEDWYFDKHLSQFLVRIIALGPVIVEEDGLSQVCWIPYEANRKVFANAFVYNMKNQAERRTYDEILIKRVFDSYIIKEENHYDRYINAYAFNIDALYESERIKNEMFELEESLWEY